MHREQIRAKGPRLEGCEPRRGSRKGHIRCGFPLEHLPHKNELPAFVAVANAIADHALADHGREFWREVAHLVGVRKQNQIWLGAFDYLFQCDAKAIWRVRFEQVMFDAQYFRDILRG